MSAEDLRALSGGLLRDCANSPALTQDLAGIEGYIAETYSYRAAYELIQNADDAGSTSVHVVLEANNLLLFNDGRVFTIEDIESLCRSAYSRKSRGESIGYRGIGFKSLVGLCYQITVLSGQYCFSFSRELTQAALGTQLPVPLIRVPHINEQARAMATSVAHRHGFDTDNGALFVLANVDREKVLRELELLDGLPLLFLRSLCKLTTSSERGSRSFVIERRPLNGKDEVATISSHQTMSFLITRGKVAQLAYKLIDGQPVPLNRDEAVVYAYLPTSEPTGLGLIINGDFSTDPSRTRVVLDERTKQVQVQAAELVCEAIQNNLLDPAVSSILDCIAPTLDLGLAKFAGTAFATEFFSILRSVWQENSTKVVLRPSWLNRLDFEKIVPAGSTCLSEAQEEIGGLASLLEYLGEREVNVTELLEDYQQLSPVGSAECLAQAKLLALQGILPEQAIRDARLPMFYTTRGPVSYTTLIAEGGQGTDSYVRVLAERVGGEAEAVRIISEVAGQSAIPTKQSPDPLASNTALPLASEIRTLNLKKNWQGAESLVVEVLELLGWSARDVSRQNVGYDIEASRAEEKAHVEVKLVDVPGKSFTLTTNEEGVARLLGETFYIAIVWSNSQEAQIAFVQNPLSTLRIERVCKQWAYVCDGYPTSGLKVSFVA